MIEPRLPVGLCLFGLTYTTGRAGAGTPRANLRPMLPVEFLHYTAELGLSGVEVPLDFAGATVVERSDFRALAEDLRLRITLAGPRADEGDLLAGLERAVELGAPVMRCTLSGVLCADRRPLGGLEGWRRHLDAVAVRLAAAAPVAEAAGVRIGLENHQDATSWDLVELCERIGSSHVGVTLDCGNPLAVAEDPLAFCDRVAPHLVHAHLKDYWIFGSDEGFRLVRAPWGEGVIDFAGLRERFPRRADFLPSLELAALEARHIRVLEPDYWAGLGPRDIAEVAPVLQLWRRHDRTGDWRTPWEAGRDRELVDWELDQTRRSVENLRRLWG